MGLSLSELGSVYSDALEEIISKFSGFSLAARSSDPDLDFSGAVGVMSLGGENSGTLFISASEPDMRAVCSFMTGVPKEEVTKEDIDDALCELVNMTAGNVKLRLGRSGYTFTLSTPFVINGGDMSLVIKKRTRIISRTLGDGAISIKLKVIC